jgi:hypothetical protein
MEDNFKIDLKKMVGWCTMDSSAHNGFSGDRVCRTMGSIKCQYFHNQLGDY